MDPEEVDGIVNRARSFQAVVLDLRGNPGGLVRAEEKFVGGFFDHDVKLGDRTGRAKLSTAIAKTRGGKAFAGKLIVGLWTIANPLRRRRYLRASSNSKSAGL